jgi:hypothetical protein
MPEQTKSGIWLPDREEKANGFPVVDFLLHQGGSIHAIGPEPEDVLRWARELIAFIKDPERDLLEFTDPIFGDDQALTKKGAESVLAVVRGWPNKVALKALSKQAFATDGEAEAELRARNAPPIALGIGRIPGARH